MSHWNNTTKKKTKTKNNSSLTERCTQVNSWRHRGDMLKDGECYVLSCHLLHWPWVCVCLDVFVHVLFLECPDFYFWDLSLKMSVEAFCLWLRVWKISPCTVSSPSLSVTDPATPVRPGVLQRGGQHAQNTDQTHIHMHTLESINFPKLSFTEFDQNLFPKVQSSNSFRILHPVDFRTS